MGCPGQTRKYRHVVHFFVCRPLRDWGVRCRGGLHIFCFVRVFEVLYVYEYKCVSRCDDGEHSQVPKSQESA